MFQDGKIKNIIFDLGGVLLLIDYDLTEKAFKKLGLTDFDKLYNQFNQNNLFDAYETGKISSDEFRKALKQHLPVSVSNEQIDAAWNTMLLEMPEERIAMLYKLKKHFNIYLFSNTNEIHIKHFREYMDTKFGKSLFDDIFIEHYYSHKLGARKPNPASFQKVLDLENLKAEETFFIDDSPQHIEGAKSIGIKAYHLNLKTGETVLDVFKDYLT